MPEAPLFAGTSLAKYDLQIDKGSITEVTDPLGSGQKVFAFTVPNEGIPGDEEGKVCRAQALCPQALYTQGAELWERFAVMIPVGFPEVTNWLTFQALYGPPFEGSSPLAFAIDAIGTASMEGEYMCMRRNGTYSIDVPWAIRVPRGQWVEFIVHQKFSSNPTGGFIEVWVNGVKVTFFDGSTYNPRGESSTQKLVMQLADGANGGGPNQAKVMHYRALDSVKATATLYQKPLRIGTTRASVESEGSTLSYSSEVLADSPLAWWRLGEPSGTVAADSSGHAHPGEYTNAPELNKAGAISSEANTAVKFNGTNQRVVIPNFTGPGDTFSIEAWVKRTAEGGAEAILHLGVGAAYLRLSAGRPQLLAASTAELRISEVVVPADSSFHHVVVTKTGTTIKIYIDGVSVTLGGSSSTACVNSGEAFGIAAFGTGAGGEWDSATLDEVALYGTALSEARVKAHFTAASETTGSRRQQFLSRRIPIVN